MSDGLLTLSHAQSIANVFLEAMQRLVSEPLTFVGEPIDFIGGWLFLYDSERYVRTGDITAALGGQRTNRGICRRAR